MQIIFEKSADLSNVPALSVGDWSDWFRVKFLRTEAICRFKLIRFDDEELRVYLSSVQISPYNPAYPISHPPEFSAELAREVGPYKTKSFWTDHDALQYGRISEELFLEDAYYSLGLKVKITKHLLNTREWDLFIAFQHVIDAVQHVFWAHMDANHPSYTKEGAGTYGDVIPDVYGRVDEGVGEILSVVGDDTTVIVMSDHGHGPCYGHVYLNTWLYRKGLLETKKGTNEINWKRTEAYCIGFAGIHLNVKDRMSMGMVKRGQEYEDLRKEITSGLRGIVFHGRQIIDDVRLREDEYQNGPYFDLTPDVIPIFAKGYMLAGNDAWGKALVDSPIVKEYTGKRFGTHTSTAPAQFGFLLMKGPRIKENLKVRARIIDVMPTLMPLLGLKVPSDVDGRTLTECLVS